MNLSIDQLLSEPESKTLEFKRDLSSPKPLLKTLVAFANTAGGKLIVGVEDNKTIFGFEQPLDEEERLANMIADSIAPRLVPNIEMVTVDGKTLLVVEVFLSGSRPHWLKAEGAENGVYVRLGSSNRQADFQLIAELQRGVAGVSFDTLSMVDLDVEALDLGAIESDFHSRNVDGSMLQSLKILVKDQGRLVPSQGGILLYGKERRFYFDDAWIQCGRFIGSDKGDIFDHIDIHDPLPKAVDSIMLFLKKHAMRGADFSEIRRKDLWSIPLNILREVVINALVHADYSHRGTPIRVAFFDNRIEVESPGLLLPGLTVADMKLGISQIRNPIIARVFRELDLIEQWGSGVPGIFREAETLGLPEPFIEEIGMRVRFTVYFNEPVAPLPEQSRKSLPESSKEKRSGLWAQSGAQSGAQSEVVLKILINTSLSAAELVDALGLETKTGAFKRTIKDLLEKELIAYTIPEKPNSRLQKYRITDQGKVLIQEKGAGNE